MKNVALVLLDLIGVITHIAYDGTFGWSLVQPILHHFGWLTIFIPVIGGLITGKAGSRFAWHSMCSTRPHHHA